MRAFERGHDGRRRQAQGHPPRRAHLEQNGGCLGSSRSCSLHEHVVVLDAVLWCMAWQCCSVQTLRQCRDEPCDDLCAGWCPDRWCPARTGCRWGSVSCELLHVALYARVGCWGARPPADAVLWIMPLSTLLSTLRVVHIRAAFGNGHCFWVAVDRIWKKSFDSDT